MSKRNYGPVRFVEIFRECEVVRINVKFFTKQNLMTLRQIILVTADNV